MSIDPAITQTLQPYAYANGDPISKSDPTGCGVCDRTYTSANGYFKVHFWRTRLSGRVGWDFRLGVPFQAWLSSWWMGINEVEVTMPHAAVNYWPIATPYGPHLRWIGYDFHASLRAYTFIRGMGSGVIRTGDQLSLSWLVVGGSFWADVEAGFSISCSVPRPGSGTAGPYGPYMNQ